MTTKPEDSQRWFTGKRFWLALAMGIVGLPLSTFLVLDHLWPLDRDRLDRPLATRILDRHQRVVRLHLSSDGYWRFRAAPEEIPENLKGAVLAVEDRFFYAHCGINPVSLVRAVLHNLSQERLMGGSTITMQVARMMHRRPRHVTSKLIEIFTALQLEAHFTKDQILNYYLNLAPYGGNIEGVAAAARFYFDKPLHALSIAEIALLTTIPKNPNANRPDRGVNLAAGRRRVVETMARRGVISPDQARRALVEPIRARRIPPAFTAPHFTAREHYPPSGRPTIVTTMDRDLYTFVRQRLTYQIAQLAYLDVHNAAAVVIHNPSMEIRTYVGSHDFFDTAHGGQNDGVQMVRSPGSALKPFIYARAFDAGLVTPQKQVFDIPFAVGGYAPRNFDRRFYGVVTAAEALQASLNIPAIELNLLLEDKALYELLRQAGVRSVDQGKRHYGAAIAVGGVGLSLLDLAHLYTALANQGRLRPLLRTPRGVAAPARARELFSAEAAWLVSEILADGFRKEFSAHWNAIRDIPKVAFKTGTSAGGRDLLTIGYNREYTVAVWVGNFDGTRTQDLTGIDAASEVMFDIFRQLSRTQRFEWLERPADVKREAICPGILEAVDGFCPDAVEDWVIASRPRPPACRRLRAEVLAYLVEAGRIEGLNDLRFHECYAELAALKPHIAAPHDGALFAVDGRRQQRFGKIQLQCYSFQPDPTIYWLVDAHPPRAARSGQPLLLPLDEGAHRIACLDSSSQITWSRFHIQKESQ